MTKEELESIVHIITKAKLALNNQYFKSISNFIKFSRDNNMLENTISLFREIADELEREINS